MFPCCWIQSAVDMSGSVISEPVLEIRALDVSVVQQSGLHLSKLFESEAKSSALSGPLPSEILNTFEKLSRNILPPSPKEVQEPDVEVQASDVEVQASVQNVGVEVQASVQNMGVEVQASVKNVGAEVQASVKSVGAEVQTLVGENRLEVPKLR